ncbi:MAG: hypothetical protein WD851_09850 [Pirellulales bacterium]
MAPITIPPEIEIPLADEARLRGTTPELLAIDCLRRQFVAPKANGTKNDSSNLAEHLRDFVGVIQSGDRIPGGAQMSKNPGAKFTELLYEQERGRRA